MLFALKSISKAVPAVLFLLHYFTAWDRSVDFIDCSIANTDSFPLNTSSTHSKCTIWAAWTPPMSPYDWPFLLMHSAYKCLPTYTSLVPQ